LRPPLRPGGPAQRPPHRLRPAVRGLHPGEPAPDLRGPPHVPGAGRAEDGDRPVSPDSALAAFTEPLRYPFMLRALLAGTLVGIAGAVIGSFLLVRRWSLLGDAISHAVLPGVALSYLV